MNSKIKAVTFDLWDTILINDSDEPKRAALGLLSKPDERRSLLYQFLKRGSAVTREEVRAASGVADAAFRYLWYEQNITLSAAERISMILTGLKHELPQEELNNLIKNFEELELKIQPELAAGIGESIKSLSKKYKLGIISDTIFSPGRVLRQIMEEYNLAHYFDSFVFSDEVGRSKPDRRVFETAAKDLGVEISEIVHIGDREEKDIVGPHQVNAKAIYTTVVLDRGSNTKAEATCDNYRELENIIDNLGR